MCLTHWIECYQYQLKDYYRHIRDEEELAILLAIDRNELRSLWYNGYSPLQAFKKYLYDRIPNYYEPSHL